MGYPDDTLGQRVCAYVVASEPFDLAACRRWMEERGVTPLQVARAGRAGRRAAAARRGQGRPGRARARRSSGDAPLDHALARSRSRPPRTPGAQQPGQAFAVVGGVAERSPGRAATRFRNRCRSCSQVKPMPPCTCSPDAITRLAASRAPDLGGRRGDRRVGIAGRDGPGAVPGGRAHALDVDHHVGAPVLDRLERCRSAGRTGRGPWRTAAAISSTRAAPPSSSADAPTAAAVEQRRGRVARRRPRTAGVRVERAATRATGCRPSPAPPPAGPAAVEVDGPHRLGGAHDGHVGDRRAADRIGAPGQHPRPVAGRRRPRAIAAPRHAPAASPAPAAPRHRRAAQGRERQQRRRAAAPARRAGPTCSSSTAASTHPRPRPPALLGHRDAQPALLDHRPPQRGVVVRRPTPCGPAPGRGSA